MQARFLTLFLVVSAAAIAGLRLILAGAERSSAVLAVAGAMLGLVALAGVVALGRMVVVTERTARRRGQRG